MSTVEEIFNAVKDLPPNEQAEVKRRLDTLVPQTGADLSGKGGTDADAASQAAIDLDQRIQRALYDAGLVREIKQPVKRPRRRHPPIKIKGKPLSETIIEERR
jgi:hypothetical protein